MNEKNNIEIGDIEIDKIEERKVVKVSKCNYIMSIEEEELENLYEKFYQVDSTNKSKSTQSNYLDEEEEDDDYGKNI